MTRLIPTALKSFAAARDGAITVLNIFLLMTIAIVGGIAVDMANLISARTQLQVAADVASHAALYARHEDMDVATAKQTALDLALENMPKSRFGEVLRIENIHFGTYDAASKKFKIDDAATDAVYVATDRLKENANPVSSFLLQLVGFWDWDVVTTSVFEIYTPGCLTEGFVANDRVDMQSGNTFYKGFCVHSNSHVEVNMNNVFQDDVYISMPKLSDFVMPEDGYLGNIGLESTLMENKMRLRILSRLAEIRDGLADPTSRHFRTWVTDKTIKTVTAGKDLTADMLEKGRIHRVNCTGGTLDVAGEVFVEVGVISDCKFRFSEGSQLIDSTFVSESDDDRSITAPQGLTLGKDDKCLAGGGAQLVTWGGVASAAKLQFFGGQIIAAKDVSFAAQATGVQGVLIIAGGEIDATSLAQIKRCDSGLEGNFGVPYFRLAG